MHGLVFFHHGILKRYRDVTHTWPLPIHRGVEVRDTNDFRADNNTSNRESEWKTIFFEQEPIHTPGTDSEGGLPPTPDMSPIIRPMELESPCPLSETKT